MRQSNYNEDMAYYSRDHLTQAVRRHGLQKTKLYLYSVLAILEKSVSVAQATEEVLVSPQKELANNYTQRLSTMLPELVKSVDSRNRYYPNSLIKTNVTEYVAQYTKLISIDIMTHEFLTYKEKMTYILHNALLFITQATEIVMHVSEDMYWNNYISILCDLIELIHPEFSDASNESSIIFENMSKDILKLRNTESPIYTQDWKDIILPNTQEDV